MVLYISKLNTFYGRQKNRQSRFRKCMCIRKINVNLTYFYIMLPIRIAAFSDAHRQKRLLLKMSWQATNKRSQLYKSLNAASK